MSNNRWHRNSDSFFKLVNDFLVDIMGAIIPGFLTLFSFMVAVGIPIILINGIPIHPKLISAFFSFGAIILILILSYVIGHAFYRSDINEPDKKSIEKKMYEHIKTICNDFGNEVKWEEVAVKANEASDKSGKITMSGIDRYPTVKYRMEGMRFDDHFRNHINLFCLELQNALVCNDMVDPLPDNIRAIFKEIKSFFDEAESNNKADGKTLRDYLNLIDILSDCLEAEVKCRLTKYEENDKTENAKLLRAALRVFFKQARAVDYCDNYDEFKYVLAIIASIDKDDFDVFKNRLDDYKKYVLVESGVEPSFFNDYDISIENYLLKEQGRRFKVKCKEWKQQRKHNHELASRDKKDLCKQLLVYAAIRKVQNEEGSPHKDAGAFPYINYENYLISRNLPHLAETINWNYREGRTKNQINRYKIKIQLFSPDAYGVLNKNESHVRMAASTWFASRFLQKLNLAICLVLAAIVIAKITPVCCGYWCLAVYPFLLFSYSLIRSPHIFPRKHNKSRLDIVFYTFVYTIIPLLLLAFLILKSPAEAIPCLISPFCPLFVNGLLVLLESRIEDFIHYQRLREIYFVIYTYHECRDAIRHREREYSNGSNHDRLIQSNR